MTQDARMARREQPTALEVGQAANICEVGIILSCNAVPAPDPFDLVSEIRFWAALEVVTLG